MGQALTGSTQLSLATPIPVQVRWVPDTAICATSLFTQHRGDTTLLPLGLTGLPGQWRLYCSCEPGRAGETLALGLLQA